MRGKACSHRFCTGKAGSPPRVRGKADRAKYNNDWRGITPARAGKSILMVTFRIAGRDHPRACGEKSIARLGLCPLGGSPPRVRGKAVSNIDVKPKLGITPARAGKSNQFRLAYVYQWDHPRACGEKLINQTLLRIGAGSPPRVRGKGIIHLGNFVKYRITPARAGKRKGL